MPEGVDPADYSGSSGPAEAGDDQSAQPGGAPGAREPREGREPSEDREPSPPREPGRPGQPRQDREPSEDFDPYLRPASDEGRRNGSGDGRA